MKLHLLAGVSLASVAVVFAAGAAQAEAVADLIDAETSAQVLEQMAEQQAQIVRTVGLLRTGATRLAWACGVLGVCVLGLLIALLRQ